MTAGYLSSHPQYRESALYRVLKLAAKPLKVVLKDGAPSRASELQRGRSVRSILSDALAHLYMSGDIELAQLPDVVHSALHLPPNPKQVETGRDGSLSNSLVNVVRYFDSMTELFEMLYFLEWSEELGEVLVRDDSSFKGKEFQCLNCGKVGKLVPTVHPRNVFAVAAVHPGDFGCFNPEQKISMVVDFPTGELLVGNWQAHVQVTAYVSPTYFEKRTAELDVNAHRGRANTISHYQSFGLVAIPTGGEAATLYRDEKSGVLAVSKSRKQLTDQGETCASSWKELAGFNPGLESVALWDIETMAKLRVQRGVSANLDDAKVAARNVKTPIVRVPAGRYRVDFIPAFQTSGVNASTLTPAAEGLTFAHFTLTPI